MLVVFAALVVNHDSLRPWLVMLVTMHLIRVPFGLSQALDAWHHGGYGPEEHFSSYLPQVQLLDEIVVSVVCNDIRPGPAVHHSGNAAGTPHHQGHLHPRRGAEFDPHGSDSHLHGVQQVQLLDKVVVPVVCAANVLIQRRITVEVPQLQFLFKVVIIPVGGQRKLPMVSLFRDH